MPGKSQASAPSSSSCPTRCRCCRCYRCCYRLGLQRTQARFGRGIRSHQRILGNLQLGNGTTTPSGKIQYRTAVSEQLIVHSLEIQRPRSKVRNLPGPLRGLPGERVKTLCSEACQACQLLEQNGRNRRIKWHGRKESVPFCGLK